MAEEKKNWPGFTGKVYPELCTTIPPQPKTLKPGQLSEDQVKKFFDEGFLLLESFFAEDELNPGKEAINELVEELAQTLYKAGKIKSLYSDHGYQSRLTKLEEDFPGANILLHKLGKLPPAFQNIWAHERLLNVVEQLLGTSDLVGHPVWNLRCKTPSSNAATVPWHQDTAYLDIRSYDVFQLTAWIPLVNATKETGCLQLLRYGHKSGLTAMHQCCANGTWYVMLDEDEMRKSLGCDMENDIVTCEVNYGSLLLFSNLLPHQSLMNNSDIVRWSLDFRWQSADKPVGFFDIKEGVKMRSSTDSNFKIDWDLFNTVSRHDTQKGNDDIEWHKSEGLTDFATAIPGPWMLKWEISNPNRHTEALPTEANVKWGHLIVG